MSLPTTHLEVLSHSPTSFGGPASARHLFVCIRAVSCPQSGMRGEQMGSQFSTIRAPSGATNSAGPPPRAAMSAKGQWLPLPLTLEVARKTDVSRLRVPARRILKRFHATCVNGHRGIAASYVTRRAFIGQASAHLWTPPANWSFLRALRSEASIYQRPAWLLHCVSQVLLRPILDSTLFVLVIDTLQAIDQDEAVPVYRRSARRRTSCS